MYDAALVQVEDCGQELTNERTRSALAEPTVLLTLDVRQQFAAACVLRYQAVQRSRLHHQQHTRHLLRNTYYYCYYCYCCCCYYYYYYYYDYYYWSLL